MAAARNTEEAKEVFTKDGRRGVFSYCLLELLNDTSNGTLTYRELINRIHPRIKNLVDEQSPQITSTIPNDKDQYFLTQNIKPTNDTYYAHWYKEEREWRINAGKMQGVTIGLENALPKFEMLNSDRIINVIRVDENYTLINNLNGLKKKKTYPV